MNSVPPVRAMYNFTYHCRCPMVILIDDRAPTLTTSHHLSTKMRGKTISTLMGKPCIYGAPARDSRGRANHALPYPVASQAFALI